MRTKALSARIAEKNSALDGKACIINFPRFIRTTLQSSDARRVKKEICVREKSTLKEKEKQMTYDEFEKIIIEDIIQTYPEHAEKLARQYNSAIVTKRTVNSPGFYTNYEIGDKTASLGDGVDLQLGENQWNVNGMKYGSDYILWIKNGFISSLEGFSYGEPWPAKITEVSKIKRCD